MDHAREIQHTPGPWSAGEWTCHARTTILVDDPTAIAGRRAIAECETEQDAGLMAAALELFDAAKAAEAVLARGRWIESSTDPEAVALRMLRAAIAKAMGA